MHSAVRYGTRRLRRQVSPGWLCGRALAAHTAAGAEQTATDAEAPAYGVRVRPPDDDWVSPAMMTCYDLEPVRKRRYVDETDAR